MKNELDNRSFSVCLIGAGPACISAAIQLKRSGINIIVISVDFGGLIKNANLIENLLGFPHGISGIEFCEILKKQVKTHDINILYEEVSQVEYSNKKFLIHAESNKIISDYLVIGTGTIPKKLKVAGEEEAYNKRLLFYEISKINSKCPINEVGIIGSGDIAYDNSINLSNLSKKITIIQRKSKSKALKLLQNRAIKNPIIQTPIIRDVKKIEVLGDQIIAIFENGEKFNANLLLVAIGRAPNLNFLSQDIQNKMSQNLLSEQIFLIGDVKNGRFRQVSIAMGDGMRVAMQILSKFK